MKSEILSQEGNVVVVKAGFESGDVRRAVGETIRELSSKANIKGFRKGHVPRKTLELYFGRPAIYRDTLERLAGQALDSVVSEYDLDLVAKPKGSFGEIVEGLPLDLEFTFEVRPEVSLPDISSLSAERTVFSVKDSDVEESFRQILESNATIEPIDDDRPAAGEDIVEAQYSSYLIQDDGNRKKLEEDKKNVLHLATLRADIAEAIIGHKPAEEFSFEIKLEDDYPDARMAGRAIHYEIEILNFMRRVVPEAVDERIAEISKGRYKTVDEIKSDLRSQMEETAKERGESTLRESAIKALAAASEVDVPEGMINRQYDAMRREHDGHLQRNLNRSLDDYLKDNNLNADEFDGNLRKRAEDIVRNTLVLDALAERDEITFTSDDISKEIMVTANRIKVNPQELADSLSKDKEAFASLAARVRTMNTMKHLASMVRVTEKVPEAEAEDPSAPDGKKEDSAGEE
ncbi:MAG: trigger factor [Synergistaceae bacterium]|nr:trigger factor [Synergistaceae bacterium]